MSSSSLAVADTVTDGFRCSDFSQESRAEGIERALPDGAKVTNLGAGLHPRYARYLMIEHSQVFAGHESIGSSLSRHYMRGSFH